MAFPFGSGFRASHGTNPKRVVSTLRTSIPNVIALGIND